MGLTLVPRWYVLPSGVDGKLALEKLGVSAALMRLPAAKQLQH